jgi:hypothetical protein
MRAYLLALLVLVVTVVVPDAVFGVQYYIDYFYGSSSCSTSDSRVNFIGVTYCFSYNSTYTLTTESAVLSNCDETTGEFNYTSYVGTGCTGSVRDNFKNASVGVCQPLSTVNGRSSSMKVFCSYQALANYYPSRYTTYVAPTTSTRAPTTSSATTTTANTSTTLLLAFTSSVPPNTTANATTTTIAPLSTVASSVSSSSSTHFKAVTFILFLIFVLSF